MHWLSMIIGDRIQDASLTLDRIFFLVTLECQSGLCVTLPSGGRKECVWNCCWAINTFVSLTSNGWSQNQTTIFSGTKLLCHREWLDLPVFNKSLTQQEHHKNIYEKSTSNAVVDLYIIPNANDIYNCFPCRMWETLFIMLECNWMLWVYSRILSYTRGWMWK